MCHRLLLASLCDSYRTVFDSAINFCSFALNLMSLSKPSLTSANFSEGIWHSRPSESKTLLFPARPSPMWRNCAKQAFWRNQGCRLSPQPSSRTSRHVLGKSQDSSFSNEPKSRPFELVFGSAPVPREEVFVRGLDFGNLRNSIRFDAFCPRAFSTVAEAVSSSTDIEDDVSVDEEFQGLMKDMDKQERRRARHWRLRRQAIARGMGQRRYELLKRRQVKIETEEWERAATEYKELLMDMCSKKLAPNLPYMKSLFLGWFEPLRSAIENEQEMCRNRTRRTICAPYFVQLPPEMMAIITMHKLMALMMTKEEHGVARVVQAALAVGDAIEQEVKIQRFMGKSKKKKVGEDNENKEDPGTKIEEKLKKNVTKLMKQKKLRAVRQIVNTQDGSRPWGQNIKAKVGSRLIELLIQTAYIQPPVDQFSDDPPEIRPAFVHTHKILTKDARTGRKFGFIQCDPLVAKGLEKSANHMVIPYMPMLVPPVNWTGYDKGGHFFLPSYIMRTHGVRQQREAVKRVPRKQLEPVFEALDTLGSTKWRINKRVLSVVERIWAGGGRLADLVDRGDIPLPEKPDTEDEELIKTWKWKVKSVRKQNKERYSQRCDTELKLSVARKMKDEEGFYYPHNVDFRGRAYPMHPHLNHLGSDLCRGILEFAEGRPLGKSGLRWLKIHLANLYAVGGVDKLSHEGRIVFVENHLDEIFDSADRPIEGNRWWLNAEDPFQCLAVCINLTDALRSYSPETFISHVHVHQDGSCNGLQHYAALGRDKLGAASVNLIAGDKPADVYSGIAKRVLEIMHRDVKKDPEVFPDALRAKAIINQVDRKLVKQTVMTSVYGVTYIGARDQIARRLKERGEILDDKELFGCACYAAKITLTALGEMFEAARDIMTWLGDCAKIIASQNEPVKWTSPLGLPVVQPYRKLGKRFIKTSLQILTVHRETEKVMVKRQRTAFPPNFVHSLDGSHMMMTAVACRKAGITFAGVHDSYWTHASDVDEMNRILREKFVELYETSILENLLESFEEDYPGLAFPSLPERGDFDLKDVLESPYFFN